MTDQDKKNNASSSRNRTKSRSSDASKKRSSSFNNKSRSRSFSNKNKRNFQKSSKSNEPKKKFTNKISDHFSKKDFACQESGKFRISLGLVGALEELRTLTQKRITIVKGYECPEVAEKKGQLKRNFHTQGLAADIQISDMSPVDVFLAVEKCDAFIGIGLNLTENYVHVDTRKAERLLWVEEGNEEIPLTEDNRKTYFK